MPPTAPNAESITAAFTYHPPKPAQVPIYEGIRDRARDFALYLNEVVPDGPDKSAAIRKLRECVMTANAAVALGS
jgi:hypothetical protein